MTELKFGQSKDYLVSINNTIFKCNSKLLNCSFFFCLFLGFQISGIKKVFVRKQRNN